MTSSKGDDVIVSNFEIAYPEPMFGDFHGAKSWNSILKDVDEESYTK